MPNALRYFAKNVRVWWKSLGFEFCYLFFGKNWLLEESQYLVKHSICIPGIETPAFSRSVNNLLQWTNAFSVWNAWIMETMTVCVFPTQGTHSVFTLAWMLNASRKEGSQETFFRQLLWFLQRHHRQASRKPLFFFKKKFAFVTLVLSDYVSRCTCLWCKLVYTI